MSTGANNKDQRAGFANHDSERMKQILREALPPIGEKPQPQRDLWPSILRRIGEHDTRGATAVPWFDWALAGGLLALFSVAPRAIPVILYYL